MANFDIRNIAIKGIAAAVPSRSVGVEEGGLFSEEEKNKFVQAVGIERRRIADKDTCTSDLCLAAAQRLLTDLSVDAQQIEVLVFVSQTPDYTLPISASIIQDKLGLPQGCMAIDLTLGCSGYVYGLSVIASLMNTARLKYGLLMAGDTISKIVSPTDKSTEPLFGDAGSATLLQYDDEAGTMLFDMGTDGSGYNAIIVPAGGSKKKISEESFVVRNYDKGIDRNDTQLQLNGMDVFTFGISQVPKTVKALMTTFNIADEQIDYYVFHQANKMMNEQIRKKLKIVQDKVPYSLQNFGNTSSATIPLTMVTELYNKPQHRNILLCGFGVGLSWGTVYVASAMPIYYSNLVEV